MLTQKTRPSGNVHSSSYRRILHALIPLTLGLFVQVASAHAPSHADKPRYGGEVRRAGDLFLELVVEPNGFAVYARNERGRPVLLADMRAEALLWTYQGTQTLSLRRVGGEQLVASAQLPEAGNFRVIISLTPPASEQRRVLFGPLSLANAL